MFRNALRFTFSTLLSADCGLADDFRASMLLEQGRADEAADSNAPKQHACCIHDRISKSGRKQARRAWLRGHDNNTQHHARARVSIFEDVRAFNQQLTKNSQLAEARLADP